MGSRIKELREKRGIIQAILAAELGITQQMLSKYERDITSIKVDVLKRLAEYFCVTTDYILGVERNCVTFSQCTIIADYTVDDLIFTKMHMHSRDFLGYII